MMNHKRRQFLHKSVLMSALTTFRPILWAESTAASEKQRDIARPNIVFLISDDQSVPDLGCYGNQRIHTPNIDALASQGRLFRRAYAACPQCSPSRASILTGQMPHAIGASRLHASAYPSVKTLVDWFKDEGYFTGAYRKVHQDIFRQRFDFYGDHTVPLGQFFLQRPRDRPFLLWFGSEDPHRPYEKQSKISIHAPENVLVPDYLPDTPVIRRDLAHYYNEITRFDQECGEIIEWIESAGAIENTLIIMTSDNGLPFPRAKATLYEPGVHVPLIVAWKNAFSGSGIIDEMVSLTDIAPSLLEAAQIKPGTVTPLGQMYGHSFLPLLFGQKMNQWRQYVFLERNWHDSWSPMRGLVTKQYKLICNYRPEAGYLPSLDIRDSPSFSEIERLLRENSAHEQLGWYSLEKLPRFELYDLERDPNERDNLAAEPGLRGILESLMHRLGNEMKKTADFLPPPLNAFPDWVKGTIDPLDGRRSS